MAIDPEIEEVLTTLIDTVEERVGEIKTLLGEESGRLNALEERVGDLSSRGAGGAPAGGTQALSDSVARLEKQLQTVQQQQAQINGFLTGVLKLMLSKKMITQQEMIEVYKSTK